METENKQKEAGNIIFKIFLGVILILVIISCFVFITLKFRSTNGSFDGFGKSVKLKPGMLQPEMHKSSDFDGVITYDPNYNPEEDTLLQLIRSIDGIISPEGKHDYKDSGGPFSKSISEASFEWKIDSGKSKITIAGKMLDYDNLDSKEQARSKTALKDEGFITDDINSTNDIAGYKKNNLVCLYSEKPSQGGIEIKCGEVN
jgi:hypothetical protein